MNGAKSILKGSMPLLLFIILMQAGGLWIGIKLLQALRIVQQEIRAKSNPENAVSFTISKAQFQACAMDDGKELKRDGNMFDVISIEFKADSVLVSALEDQIEARLIALLNHTSTSTDKNASSDAYMMALMHLQFIPPANVAFEFMCIPPRDTSEFIGVTIPWDSDVLRDLEQPPESKRNIV